MNKIFLITCLSLLVFLINGCDFGKLSRSNAEKILAGDYPKAITVLVRMHEHDFGRSYTEAPIDIEKLNNIGILTYELVPVGTIGYGCDAELTEEGKKYLSTENSPAGYIRLISAQIEFSEIKSIREIPANNSAIVEYTEKVTQITPIGTALDNIQIGQTETKRTTFIKSDNGWHKADSHE